MIYSVKTTNVAMNLTIWYGNGEVWRRIFGGRKLSNYHNQLFNYSISTFITISNPRGI